jgi:phage host-nuclease inhibitor protein Gam
MSKRITKKITPAGAEYTRAQAEEIARSLASAQIRREILVAERDAAALAATVPFAPQIDALDTEINAALSLLNVWSDHHLEEFGKAESITLSGHRVGWRLGNYAARTLPKLTWEKVVAIIQGKKKATRERYLRTKVEANKEALIADRKATRFLARLGVQIVQEKRFYFEPSREGQADTTLTNPTA